MRLPKWLVCDIIAFPFAISDNNSGSSARSTPRGRLDTATPKGGEAALC